MRIGDVQSVMDTADGPAAYADRREVRLDVNRALALLPPDQREAFVMHYVEGMSYEEMAELLDASVSALKMRVFRARRMLSAALSRPDVTNQPVGAS